MRNNKSSNTQDIKEMLDKYMHFCDECHKAYDFTCSGLDAKKCEAEKNRLLLEIKKKD